MTQQERKIRSIATKVIVVLLLVYAATQILVVATFLTDTDSAPNNNQNVSTLPIAKPTLVSLNESVTFEHIVIKVNNVSNTSDPDVRETWIRLSSARSPVPLSPSEGNSCYIANVTITNELSETVLFKYTNIVLIGSDRAPHYASASTCEGGQTNDSHGSNTPTAQNNALDTDVGSARNATLRNQSANTSSAGDAANCYKDVVVNQTLTGHASYSVYILYVVPERVAPTDVRYQIWM